MYNSGGPAYIFQILELPMLLLCVAFAVRVAVVLRKPGLTLSGEDIGRGMIALAAGFIVMGIGHLVMQADRFFGADIFNLLFGPRFGQLAWFVALTTTWCLSGFGFYYIMHAVTEARIKLDTEDLRKHAFQDSLTGILNRRALEHRALKAIEIEGKDSRALTILILDLDFFKNINDTYGHPVGDEVLRVVARTVSGLLREGDVFGRFGGEEFFLLLRSGIEEARPVAERVRKAVAGISVEAASDTISVTVSIGMAVLNFDGVTLDELIESADQALYEAKARGRNTVVTAAEIRAPIQIDRQAKTG